MKSFTIVAAAVLASAVMLPAASQAGGGGGISYGGVFRQGVSLNGTDGATLPESAQQSGQVVQAVTLPDGSTVETRSATVEHD